MIRLVLLLLKIELYIIYSINSLFHVLLILPSQRPLQQPSQVLLSWHLQVHSSSVAPTSLSVISRGRYSKSEIIPVSEREARSCGPRYLVSLPRPEAPVPWATVGIEPPTQRVHNHNTCDFKINQ